MIFKKEDLQELVSEGEFDGLEVVIDEIEDRNRWSVQYRLVFRYKDKFYQTYYTTGATEYQDQAPFEDDGEEIKCKEVTRKEKVMVVYE